MKTRRTRKTKNTTKPSVLKTKLRATRAIELRCEGKTLNEIAAALGYNSKQAVWKAINTELDDKMDMPIERLRDIEIRRIDKLWQLHYLKGQAGDVDSTSICTRLSERRSRLLGLDAPVKIKDETPPEDRAIMVVPSVVTEDEWERISQQQQQELSEREAKFSTKKKDDAK